MADLDLEHDPDAIPEGDYSTAELIYWIIGILMIPLTPILMIWLLTPWSGT
ncbi:MAG TPA: hypothetical protein VFI91_09835 [Longimicrobiaceae bacterium]|nr:hypothetical protein [Longimicrobiaceae bacterium]